MSACRGGVFVLLGLNAFCLCVFCFLFCGFGLANCLIYLFAGFYYINLCVYVLCM